MQYYWKEAEDRQWGREGKGLLFPYIAQVIKFPATGERKEEYINWSS